MKYSQKLSKLIIWNTLNFDIKNNRKHYSKLRKDWACWVNINLILKYNRIKILKCFYTFFQKSLTNSSINLYTNVFMHYWFPSRQTSSHFTVYRNCSISRAIILLSWSKINIYGDTYFRLNWVFKLPLPGYFGMVKKLIVNLFWLYWNFIRKIIKIVFMF